MNKTAKRIISFLCAAAVSAPAAYAMDIDYYGKNTSLFAEGRNKLHFIGTADGKASNRMATIFVMMPGKTLADAQISENVAYMKTVSVDFDGNFEYEFGFDNESGEYPVYILVDDKQIEDNYNYKSRNDIIALFDKIRNETVAYSDVEDYSETLGLDLSVVTKDAYETTVITRILEKKNSITNDNASVDIIKDVLKNCALEFDYLESIKSASNWSEIPSILTNIETLTGVKYDYKGKSKQKVCQKLIDEEFTSAEKLQEAFDKAVKVVDDFVVGVGGSSSGGSKVTGGGSTGNYSSVVTPAVKEPSNPNAFDDISDIDWAIKPINYLYSKGMINGTGDGKFSPNAPIKREEIVKIIVNAFNLTDDAAVTAFTDTDSSMWHYKYIASAHSKGIVNGISEAKFGVGDNVTRQDIAVIIYNAAVVAGIGFTKTKTDFADFADISDYAQTAVSSMAGEGVISGMGDGSFAPKASATRAQAAKIIYEVIE